jgi:uncharacterized protein (TIGR03437 family)
VVLYATGFGRIDPPAQGNTRVNASKPPQPQHAVSARVGGQPASVLYAGATPNKLEGMLQISVQLPRGVAGPNVPVVVMVGNATSQPGITLAIQPALTAASPQRQKPTIKRSRH